MDKKKKNLDALQAQFGLIRAADVSCDTKRQTRRQQTTVPSVPRQTIEPKSDGSLLSPAVAAQLRTRMGLSASQPSPSPDVHGPVEIAQALPGRIVGNDNEGFFLYRQTFPLDHRMGDISLGAAQACKGGVVALSGCDDALHAFDPRTACFMDTETTGLAGGAGTIAFLVGLGFFDGESFILEQCFLRDYDDEPSMLEYLAEHLQGFTAVVSYNGKSFDLPLLRTRFVQHRIPFPLEKTAHYDLVHAARRVWKRRLSDCSLGNIEQEVLGFRRYDDVPGYLIPRLWLDYLDTRDARPLAAVFKHHEMDILSLAALAGHLAIRLADDSGPAFRHAEDELSVIRLHYKRKQYAAVVERGNLFLETSRITDLLRRECLLLVGQALKRIGEFEEMERIWRIAHEEYPEDAVVAEELAKYLEHHKRDLHAATDICRTTLAHITQNIEQTALPGDFSVSGLRGRLIRLERKITKMKQRDAEDDTGMFDDA